MTVPRSTVRLQFHRDFTFDHAVALVDYFADLGISHLYASPLTTAEPGSVHGYDTVDYTQVNSELGGEAALLRLVDKLRTRGMGLIADIVPNHMGVWGASNGWWLDVLEWGPHSAYANYFDIDWQSPDPALTGKLLAPVLGAAYGEELRAGKIALQFEPRTGRIEAAYYDNRLPICPRSYAALLRSATDPELAALAELFADLGASESDRARAAAGCARLREFAATPAGVGALEAMLGSFGPDVAEPQASSPWAPWNQAVTEAPSGLQRLHCLLEQQYFRLAWWRTASDEVNWRRFFDISTLGGMKVERPEVFEASHALIFRLFAQGVIDGVRVDHVDGLAEPREYCHRLRSRLAELNPGRPAIAGGGQDAPYLIVEKILARGEPMRRDWQVDGTTGYDFMNDVGALLHDPRGAAPLAATWCEQTGEPAEFAPLARRARQLVLANNLSAEVDRTVRALQRIARGDPATRDYSFTAIKRVLSELIVHYPVYRIYPIDAMRSLEDDLYFDHAVARARQTLQRGDRQLLEQLTVWLGGVAHQAGEPVSAGQAAAGGAPVPAAAAATAATAAQLAEAARNPDADGAARRRQALVLFSQLTAPVAAKAIEDTACYRYGRLLSRNEVGADPADFAMSVEAFHEANAARATHFPRGLLATATHDHKRGEDLRARLAVLSEISGEWAATAKRWSIVNTPHRRILRDATDTTHAGGAGAGPAASWAPGPAPEAMLYQMLAGAWPPELDPDDAEGIREFAGRIAAWQLKALREAKLRTSWVAPDTDFEDACAAFLHDILAPQRRDGFLAELASFASRIGPAGVINSLQQTILRLTVPGIPDLYQGTELWDFSMVDPDNRRPVDFERRRALLRDAAAPPAQHLAQWRDGRVKLGVIHRALALREQASALFAEGSYLPLKIEGPRAEHAIAFARQHGSSFVLVIASRLAAGLLDTAADAAQIPSLPLIAAREWGDTAVILPDELASRTLLDWLSSAAPKADGVRLALAEVLGSLPVALLFEEAVPAARLALAY